MTTYAPYELMGEAGIARLVDRLYYWMETLPEAQDVMAMHTHPMPEIKARLCAFLSGWLGGPDLYRSAYGEPFMRRRHFRFPIDNAARDVWMTCMQKAIDDVVCNEALKDALIKGFAAMADHMRNRFGPGDSAPACGCASHTD